MTPASERAWVAVGVDPTLMIGVAKPAVRRRSAASTAAARSASAMSAASAAERLAEECPAWVRTPSMRAAEPPASTAAAISGSALSAAATPVRCSPLSISTSTRNGAPWAAMARPTSTLSVISLRSAPRFIRACTASSFDGTTQTA